MNDPLTYARALHFAGTLSASGAIFFLVFIGEPALRAAGADAYFSAALRRHLACIAWVGLLVAAISGAAWLVLAAQSMSGAALSEVFSQDVLGTVLLQTGFGQDWMARSLLAFLLAVTFMPVFRAKPAKPIRLNIIAVALAAGFAGSLAWAGHAVGAAGLEGIIHPAADFAHLVAAAAWVGTLLPLALLLAAAEREGSSLLVARSATLRFSNFGIVSVAALLITGSINTWYLAGSTAALTETDYGRLLLLKIALFLVMVGVAAVNRLLLMPRLMTGAGGANVLRRLRRNAVIEVIVGAAIIAIVAGLGTTPPGFEVLMHGHHSH